MQVYRPFVRALDLMLPFLVLLQNQFVGDERDYLFHPHRTKETTATWVSTFAGPARRVKGLRYAERFSRNAQWYLSSPTTISHDSKPSDAPTAKEKR